MNGSHDSPLVMDTIGTSCHMENFLKEFFIRPYLQWDMNLWITNAQYMGSAQTASYFVNTFFTGIFPRKIQFFYENFSEVYFSKFDWQ